VIDPPWHQSPAIRFKVAVIAGVGYPLAYALGRTFRWRVEGLEHMDRLRDTGKPAALAFWHGRILPVVVYLRGRRLVALVSQNFDGEWIARIISRMGFDTVRGSSSRNANAAVRQLIRQTRAGRSTLFALDGPRGPARVAKDGAVWLAMATSVPIIPIHAEADRHWTVNSWDRTQLPKPFSRVALVIGQPIIVPREVDDAAMAEHRGQLERALGGLEQRALQLLKADR
jgi:lysophospholipid acyltransferase (LPLAT)-like uncharacterized protein